ncbi:MAG: response regulator transcription factor [Pseudomonadota bacterium]
MAINALLVEDDRDLSATVVDYLALEDIHCDYAPNGDAGLSLARSHPFDVLIVDVSMPVMDGLLLCEALRRDGRDVPLILLTARDTLDDKLSGFKAGADDYLTKPFEMDELVARVRALAGRRSAQLSVRQIGDLRVDFDRSLAERAGRRLELSPTGWRMLETLARHSPRTVPHEQLYEAGWVDEVPSRNNFNVQLHRLRRAVDGDESVSLLHTVSGVGIRLGEEDDV